MLRRTLLKAGLLQAGMISLLLPRRVLAAYPGNAFRAEAIPDALREIYGTADIGDNEQIEIDAPAIASDANMVPVRVRSKLPNTESIAIVVAGNASPFTAYFRLYEPQGYVSTRVRLAESGELLVVVKADGVLHANRRPVRVGNNQCRI